MITDLNEQALVLKVVGNIQEETGLCVDDIMGLLISAVDIAIELEKEVTGDPNAGVGFISGLTH